MEENNSGQVLLSTWHLGADLSIEYCVRLPDSQSTALDSNCVNVDDVFVSLDQAISLLTSVAGQTKVKPPNFKTIWTISLLGGRELDLCPLTDFVYHAALKAPGKRFKKVWEGILTGLVLQLYAKDKGGSTTSYTHLNFSECNYNRIGEQKEEESKHQAKEAFEELEAKVEVKVEDGTGVGS